MNWPVFFTRLGSAIIFSAIMITGLLFSNPWAILCLAFLIQFLCLREFMRLMARIFPEAWFPAWLGYIVQLAGVILLISIAIPESNFHFFAFLLPVLILLFTALSKKTAWTAGLAAFGGLLYIALPMGFLVALRGIHFAIPLALVLMIWMNDTMAYLVGSFIGRTPFSAISPKKTWEGTAGGVLLTVLGAVVWGYYSPLPDYEVMDWVVLSLCAALAGTAGDLLESKLKRLADVKDSGRLMPGHGGALDRFDSLLVALPFAFCYVVLFMVKS